VATLDTEDGVLFVSGMAATSTVMLTRYKAPRPLEEETLSGFRSSWNKYGRTYRVEPGREPRSDVGRPDAAMNRQQHLTSEFVAGRHALYGFIYGLVRNTHDAEDILQEVWVRFFSALEKGVEIQNQATWCRGTARNLILHYWRDRKADKVVVDTELVDLVALAFTEQEGRHDYWLARQQALKECMALLPVRSKHLLRLKYEEGLSAQAVAKRLVQSADAVLKALSRVRQALRECAAEKLKVQGVSA
jgi:RNA polymerase sigma-70 factor (ECF subfamily)